MSNLDRTVKLYLIEGITPDGYDSNPETPAELIQFVSDTFNAEAGWNIKRIGHHEALTEWMQGLPSSIHFAFTNYDILQLAIRWGSLPDNATEKQEDNILDNYFHFMATKLGQLMRGYRVPK